MVRRRLAGSGVRPLAIGILARVNPGDVRVWHPFYPRKVLLHSFRHKGYWFYGKDRESATSRFFARVIQTSDTVIEVGAHIGFRTLQFAALAPQGRVLCLRARLQESAVPAPQLRRDTQRGGATAGGRRRVRPGRVLRGEPFRAEQLARPLGRRTGRGERQVQWFRRARDRHTRRLRS